MSYKVIRNIDKLGRVVLPKSLRESLNIKIGDALELNVESGKLVISKFNRLLSISDFADIVCESIYDITGDICIISDEHNVISASGISKGILGKPLNISGNSIMLNDKSITIVDHLKSDIKKDGKVIGSILVASKDKKVSSPLSTIEILARYLGAASNG